MAGAKLVVIGLGPVTSYKYSRMIAEAIEARAASSYCIVDLESQRHLVEQRRAALPVQPETVLLLPDAEAAQLTNRVPSAFVKWLDDLAAGHRGSIKVFVATEPQAHEAYLRQRAFHLGAVDSGCVARRAKGIGRLSRLLRRPSELVSG